MAALGFSADCSGNEFDRNLRDELDDGIVLPWSTRAPSGMANIRCDKPDVSADRIWLGNHVELLADSFLDVPAETLPEDMN
jgi:hypothetical protein